MIPIDLTIKRKEILYCYYDFEWCPYRNDKTKHFVYYFSFCSGTNTQAIYGEDVPNRSAQFIDQFVTENAAKYSQINFLAHNGTKADYPII